GTWVSYPTITVTGPYNSVTIINQTTNIYFTLNVSIAGGEQRIISLTPGMETITDAAGNNKFGELGPSSDLVDFNIRPNPMVADGVNVIQCQFIGGTVGLSSMKLAYNIRYFAI